MSRVDPSPQSMTGETVAVIAACTISGARLGYGSADTSTARSWLSVGVLVAGVAANALPAERTEPYLLRVGLAAATANELLRVATPNRGAPIRAVLSLLAFWSYLHYAMNPRHPDSTDGYGQ